MEYEGGKWRLIMCYDNADDDEVNKGSEIDSKETACLLVNVCFVGFVWICKLW